MTFVEDMRKAFREELKMPLERFASLIGLFSALYFVVVVPGLVVVLPEFFLDLRLLIPVLILGVFLTVVLALYPYIVWKQRGVSIDRDMHLLITRMGVLSAAEASRKEMFDILKQMMEYRAIAGEIKKIFILVTNWNVSLERAARFVAATTPSTLFSDFLYRLAHAVEAGEPATEFFTEEQIVVMDQYGMKYESAMRNVETAKEIFLSLVVAALFLLVFVTILPLLTGENSVVMLSTAVVIFVIIEVVFLYFLYIIVPGERIWHTMKIRTATHYSVNRWLISSVFMCLGVALVALYFLTPHTGVLFGTRITLVIPQPQIPIFAAITFLPLSISSYYVLKEEDRIKKRDENFPAFIRSLGTAMEARSRDVALALRRLRTHDFGPLSKNLDDLFKRVSMRINRPKAWEYFSAETLSELISKFAEMYNEGIGQGGNSKSISKIISDNFIKLIGLRKHKFESSSSLIGLLYGLSVAIGFVLYMSLHLVDQFRKLFQAVEIPAGYPFLAILHPQSFDYFLLSILMAVLLIIHCFISSYMTKVISGGHWAGGLWHFSGMLMASAISAWVATTLMGVLL